MDLFEQGCNGLWADLKVPSHGFLWTLQPPTNHVSITIISPNQSASSYILQIDLEKQIIYVQLLAFEQRGSMLLEGIKSGGYDGHSHRAQRGKLHFEIVAEI